VVEKLVFLSCINFLIDHIRILDFCRHVKNTWSALTNLNYGRLHRELNRTSSLRLNKFGVLSFVINIERCTSFHELEFNLQVLITHILEREPEFLDGLLRISFDGKRNHVLVKRVQHYFFLTVYFGHLNSSSEKNLSLLNLCKALPVIQELFHAILVIKLQKLFKTMLKSEFLFAIGQETDVDQRHHIFGLFELWWSHNDNEVLLGFRSQLQCNAFGEFFWDWVFNEPGLKFHLTINHWVLGKVKWQLWILAVNSFELLFDLGFVILVVLRVYRKFNDLLTFRQIGNHQSWPKELTWQILVEIHYFSVDFQHFGDVLDNVDGLLDLQMCPLFPFDLDFVQNVTELIFLLLQLFSLSFGVFDLLFLVDS